MIVGLEMAVADRASFAEWFPAHLEGVLQVVDHLHVRVGEPRDQVVDLLPKEVTWEPQKEKTGRFFDEAFERQSLLDYALKNEAEWAVVFDADEVLYSGFEQIRDFMTHPKNGIWGIHHNYSSHHRKGYVLPRAGVRSWRGFRLGPEAEDFHYQGDEDGLHCGSIVPQTEGKHSMLDEVKVVHYHATTCEEYMGERAFYNATQEVAKHGGIDHLYRCDRFGEEQLAIPFAQWKEAA